MQTIQYTYRRGYAQTYYMTVLCINFLPDPQALSGQQDLQTNKACRPASVLNKTKTGRTVQETILQNSGVRFSFSLYDFLQFPFHVISGIISRDV